MPPNLAEPRLYALVPCAGVGTRAAAAGPKQYALLNGVSLIGHTLKALAQVSRLHQTMVVVSPADDAFERHAPGFAGWCARVGGGSRAESVLNGLDALAAKGALASDWVLVHDAARCLVRPEWINTLIDACVLDPVGGLLALPVADTLKLERAGRVAATIDRAEKWQAQTPQMFRVGELRTALQRAASLDAGVTDEAGAMEKAGFAPKLVAGWLENFKITYPSDFELAERLLRSRAP